MNGTRKSGLWGKITVLVVICCCSLPVQAKYGGGTGEPNDPYLIYDANQMNEIGLSGNWDDWDKCFKLMADVDLGEYTGTEFNIIGDSTTPFTGTFDGNGHVINNLTIIGGYFLGLFGLTGSSAKISNLGMQDVDITGNSIEDFALGGLVGWNCGRIDNCYVTGSVTGGDNCESIAGLAGECFGLGQGSSSIVNCYAICSVTGGAGSSSIGGLVGDGGGVITNCYAAGTVTGHGSIGGLNGTTDATITNCYFLAPADGGGPDNGQGEPLTIEQMKHQSSFVGWDFVGETANGTDYIWRLCEDLVSYPRLAWEFPLGDFLCPDGVNFVDFSFFAGHWQEDNCGASNDCDGTDLDLLGTVDINDLGIFVDNWLRGF